MALSRTMSKRGAVGDEAFTNAAVPAAFE
jgi:hypothetical protein